MQSGQTRSSTERDSEEKRQAEQGPQECVDSDSGSEDGDLDADSGRSDVRDSEDEDCTPDDEAGAEVMGMDDTVTHETTVTPRFIESLIAALQQDVDLKLETFAPLLSSAQRAGLGIIVSLYKGEVSNMYAGFDSKGFEDYANRLCDAMKEHADGAGVGGTGAEAGRCFGGCIVGCSHYPQSWFKD